MPKRSSNGQGYPDWLRYLVIIMLLTTWVASQVTDMLIRSYDPPGYMHAILVIIGGSMFGIELIRKNGKDE